MRENPDWTNEYEEYCEKRLIFKEKHERQKKLIIRLFRRKKYPEAKIKDFCASLRDDIWPAAKLNNKMLLIKRDIMRYLTVEENMAESEAEINFCQFGKYKDILNEFHTWIKTKHYPTESEGALVINGYSAKRIAEEFQGLLGPFEVYQHLVGFREKWYKDLEHLKGEGGQYEVYYK